MLQQEEVFLIIYFLAVTLLLIIFGMLFFTVFQKRKNKLLQEKLKMEMNYKTEIEKSKVEIQEQTLKNIAWELHDNIGQLLSVVNMQLNIMEQKEGNDIYKHLAEVKSIVQSTVKEVRSLSKTSNNEVIQMMGLVRSIEVELERIERLKYAKTSMQVKGAQTLKNEEDEIIMFRIVQEFLSNCIRHAKAKNINVLVEFEENYIYLSVSDDGCGFDISKKSESSGLKNMNSRAKLLKSEFEINSAINKGTQMHLKYNILKDDD